MMNNMSPEMMQAGVDMMKNMDPKMMAEMSKKMLGREISEAEMERMQSAMSNMTPEDMQKWAGRAQAVSKLAARPMAAYKWLSERVGLTTVFAVLVAMLGMMIVGHVTDTF